MAVERQLRALAACALFACAVARPDINPTKTSYSNKVSNGVHREHVTIDQFKPLKQVKQDTNEVSVAALPVPSGNTALQLAAIAPIIPKKEDVEVYSDDSEGASTPLFQDTTKPVNLRFPHAVLFGGTCGGSIIGDRWILTAAHCTLFTGGRYVLAGTSNAEDESGVRKRVKKLYMHPLFSVGPYWLDADRFEIKQVAARWDYLLAELEEPLELDGVKLAAIPLEECTTLATNTPVGYAGYGTDHHGGVMRSDMHAMDLKLRSDEQCHKLEQFNSEDMLCAQGYEPNYDSACNGDSGSGLVANGRLVGVASWVENDATECRKKNLVVFSKVATAREWIRSITNI